MAIYRIASLNYITSGTNRAFVNMDTVLDYELFRPVDILRNEDVVPEDQEAYIVSTALSVLSTDIVTEQKVSDWHKTEFLAKEYAGEESPMRLELSDLNAYNQLCGSLCAYYVQSDAAAGEDVLGQEISGIYASMARSYAGVPGSEQMSGAVAVEMQFSDSATNNAMAQEESEDSILLNER